MYTKYKRILLKLSGEFLGGSNGFGFCNDTIEHICEQIATIHKKGIEIAIVVGGGNFFRGGQNRNIENISGDYIGMLGTIMNGLYMQNILEEMEINIRVMSALRINQVTEDYIWRKAIRHLTKGRIVFFVAGLGQPCFTTDTAAALRSTEINADLLIKGTKVDGVFSADPKITINAKKYDYLSYDDIIQQDLKVMDATAITFCKERSQPIYVLDIIQKNALTNFFEGKITGTFIT